MEISILANKQKNLLLQRNILASVGGILLLSNILLGIHILTSEKQVYIVPAHLSRDVVMSNKRLSSSYLEEMSIFYLNLLLGLSEANIDYNKDIVLRHIHPGFYNHISNFLEQEKKRYQDYRLSTYFKLTKLSVNDENLVALAEGILTSYFGNNSKSADKVTYRIEYDYSGGILTIKNFVSVKDQDKEILENKEKKK